jgi:hypothetical protein
MTEAGGYGREPGQRHDDRATLALELVNQYPSHAPGARGRTGW